MFSKRISDRHYADPPATIDTWGAVVGHVAEVIAENRLAPAVSDMLVALFDRARTSGLGSLDISALAEVLRA